MTEDADSPDLPDPTDTPGAVDPSGPATPREILSRVAGSSRDVARRALDRGRAGGSSDEFELRVAHLETTLDRACDTIEMLEITCRELLVTVDHQGSRLEALQRQLGEHRQALDELRGRTTDGGTTGAD